MGHHNFCTKYDIRIVMLGSGIVGECFYRQDLTLVKISVLLLRSYGVQKKGIMNPGIMTFN